MSWGNLSQLSMYGNTTSPDIGTEGIGEKPKKVQKKAKTRAIETLDGHVRMTSFFQKETRLCVPGQLEFWGKILENHRDWFISLYPTRVQKLWLLKFECIPEAKIALEKFIPTYNHHPKGFK